MRLLLKFARPASRKDVLEEVRRDNTIDVGDFETLVDGWVESGVLVNVDGGWRLERSEAFRNAAQTYLDGGGREFPLRSSLESQRPKIFFPGLETRELHESGRFDWADDLSNATGDVLSELETLIANREELIGIYGSYTMSGSWAAAYLWGFGRALESTCEACPRTAELLSSIPGVTHIGTALFSVLRPGTIIAPHCGVTNAKLRCQLPLRVPDGCGLRVGESMVRQEVGKCIVFDDSFEHSAWNLGQELRYVLVFDFFHPDLTEGEQLSVKRLNDRLGMADGFIQEVQSGKWPDWL